MKHLLPPHALLLGFAAVLLSACGSQAGSNRVKTSAHAGPTPVPTILVSYASAVDPTLRTTLQEGRTLLAQMSAKHPDFSTLANNCSMVGGDFSSYRSVYGGTFVPRVALHAWYVGDAGFKLILAATDECGTAADSGSTKMFKGAESDLKQGLNDIGYSDWVLSHWYGRS